MICQLAERLYKAEVHHRKLYRWLDLTDEQRKQVDNNKKESDKIYDILAFYVEFKIPTVTELINNLEKVRVDKNHIDFVRNYLY